MMYSKTLIILTFLLAVALIYLVYDCKCDRENFQNKVADTSNITMKSNKKTLDENDAINENKINENDVINEINEINVSPVKLSSDYTMNLRNVSKARFPEMSDVIFYKFYKPNSKIDISNTN